MDFQRYLLIGAIAVLSYMLLIEWGGYKNEHKNVPVAANNYQQAANTGSENIASLEQGYIPNANDLPSAIPAAETPAISKAIALQQIIKIKTDSLEIDIDLHGGDIIFAALPKHYAEIDNPDYPFVLLEQSSQRTYIAQSGLIGINGTDTNKGRPTFTTESTLYVMHEDQENLIVDLHFTTEKQVKITKRFHFNRGQYVITVEYLIDNQSGESWSAGLFGQLKRDNSEDPAADTSGMGMQPYLGAAITLPDEPYNKITFDDMAENNFQQTIPAGWLAIIQHYFISAWIPDSKQTHSYSTAVTANHLNIVRFTSPAITVAAGEQGSATAQFYAGPKDQYSLEAISPGLELTVDYGWLWWIAQPLFWLLTKIHGVVGNWGFAIIGVTLLVKAAFYKLNAKAYSSMANMRKVGPKMQQIREMYADDKQKQSQEMMALYKKEKINPLGGCLPILVQMPVFISLYWVLMESVELRHAPFILWINDLSVMDPYYVLPLVMGVSMFIQQKLNPAPPDPMQAKIMQWMPVMFTFFFLFFPAGLVLYWVVNNVLSIAQQYVITKRLESL